jgi:hypothetical protein
MNARLANAELELSIQSLSVVSNNELEERVAIEAIVSKAVVSYEQPLANLTTRIDSLVAGVTVTDIANPVGPEALCCCFINACKSLELDIRAKLVLLKLYDRYVISCLGDLYRLCNQLLTERGILPGLNMADAKRQGAYKHQSNLDDQVVVADSGNVFADLQAFLHAMQNQAYSTAGQAGLSAPGQAPQIPRQKLLQLLQCLQSEQQAQFVQQQQQAFQGVAPSQIDIQQTLGQMLVAQMPGASLSIGQVENDVINLVEMLFQFILDEPQLAAPMKALLARLQIPFIKLAMQDKQFFSKGSHPARQLLNAVASACLGWEPVADTEKDSLYKKVDALVTTISDDFDADTVIFQQMLDDFNAFVEAEQRRAQLVQQRTLCAEEGKAKSDLAREQIQNLLDSKLNGLDLPEPVVQLVEGGWSRVLLHIFLKEGSESPAWQDAVATLEDLLWSMQATEDESGRQRLLKRAPKIIKALRSGLNTISYNPFQLQQLFEAIEALHLERLEAEIVDDFEPPILTSELSTDELLSVQASKPEFGVTLDQLLEEGCEQLSSAAETLAQLDAELDEQLGKGSASEANKESNEAFEEGSQDLLQDSNNDIGSVETAPEHGSEIFLDENDPIYQRVDSLTMGGWFDLVQEQDSKCRCRLAAVIRATGKYIFVNRSGVKVAEYSRHTLAQAIKNEQVNQLDDGQLFDRALESVINDLRDKKSLQG